jgi:nitrogen regulatory protein P-II 2
MQLQTLRLVTIVTEQIVREQLVKKILALGATGCSWGEVQGTGSRGARSDATGDRNVRIEVVCSAETAEKILTMVSRNYFENYACIAWQSDALVVRGARYVG